MGNTRVVFTTNPKEIGFSLNYESSESTPDDEAIFTELDNIVEADVHDHTDAGATYQKSQRLTGGANDAIGSVLTIPVGAGDKVSASVYAKYLTATGGSNPSLAIGNLLAAAITGTTGAGTYEGAITSSYGANGSMITNVFQDEVSPTEPMAFINLLFLPDEAGSSIEESHFAFKQISAASSNAHALLALDEPFEAPSAGYVVVYLSNESEVPQEVYFDDLVVTVNEHPVIQSDSYYPFGHTFNSFQRITAQRNDFLFNGIERERELDLGWDLAHFRAYDPLIGRWLQIDPKTSERESPYVGFGNRPNFFIDPLGDTVRVIGSDEFKADYQAARDYLSENGADEIVSKLESSETVFLVEETEGGSSFNPKTNKVSWDSDMGVLTDNFVEMSPTTVLNHELDHALQSEENPEQQKADRAPDPDYGNKEEKRVITGSEQDTALKLGEIKPGEVTRTNHDGSLYPTAGPTTTRPKYAVTPKNEKDKK